MTQVLTREELIAKLRSIQTNTVPAVKKSMGRAVLNVEGVAKDNCTPGKGPYSSMVFPTKVVKAIELGDSYTGSPYTFDNDPDREPPHMRDVMFSKVEVEGTVVRGIVGNPKEYSGYVHDGTSKMEPRPFIVDAIAQEANNTLAILGEGIDEMLAEEAAK